MRKPINTLTRGTAEQILYRYFPKIQKRVENGYVSSEEWTLAKQLRRDAIASLKVVAL